MRKIVILTAFFIKEYNFPSFGLLSRCFLARLLIVLMISYVSSSYYSVGI